MRDSTCHVVSAPCAAPGHQEAMPPRTPTPRPGICVSAPAGRGPGPRSSRTCSLLPLPGAQLSRTHVQAASMEDVMGWLGGFPDEPGMKVASASQAPGHHPGLRALQAESTRGWRARAEDQGDSRRGQAGMRVTAQAGTGGIREEPPGPMPRVTGHPPWRSCSDAL